MSFLGDLQQGVADRLNWDSYFTNPDAPVAVLIEKPGNLRNQYDQAIAKLGVLALVARPSIVETDSIQRITASVLVHVTENVTLNQSRSGAQKEGSDVILAAMADLVDWTPNGDLWAPFYFKSLLPLGEDEQGCEHWALEIYTFTIRDIIIRVLGTERGTAIGDDQGTAMTSS